MLARVRSGALRGIDALVVDVEVDVSSGLPHTTTVGLPDGAVREGTERIRAALRNCGFKHAERRVTVNLGPAGVRKEGAAFDLPIALGLLAAFGDFGLPDLSRWCVLGELGLDGRVHGVRGALPIAAAASRAALGALMVPAVNAPEAALAGGPPIFGGEPPAGAAGGPPASPGAAPATAWRRGVSGRPDGRFRWHPGRSGVWRGQAGPLYATVARQARPACGGTGLWPSGHPRQGRAAGRGAPLVLTAPAPSAQSPSG